MRRRIVLVLFLVFSGMLTAVPGPKAGTFTKLNEGDPWLGWACPRINNIGHIALIRTTSTSFSGSVYLWTGSWETKTEFPGVSVANDLKQPKLEMNDNERIAYQGGSEVVYVADTTGIIPFDSPPHTLNYCIDINENNDIAAYSWVAYGNNRVYTSPDPYTDFTEVAGPTVIGGFRVAINDSGQVAWKPPGTSTLYRYTPGVGNEAIGSANWAPFDMDHAGRVIHVRSKEKVMLNNMVLRQGDSVWYGTNGHPQLRISDNGRHVVWTEYFDGGYDLWTMVDGVPTNLSEGGYGNVFFPDVNNEGTIVFSEVVFGTHQADTYMYTSDDPQPIVYNGHFDGKTLFGWDPITEGSAEVVLDSTGGEFTAQLTSGSPAAIEQAIDVPAGAATLEFDFDFLSTDGTLTVSLGGVTVATLTSADDTEPGFTHREIPITTTPPLGEEGAVLSFTLDDLSVSTVRLDNIGMTTVSTGVAADASAPATLLLGRACPNPFAGNTTIRFGLVQAGPVELAVYDITGRRVTVLVDEHRGAGPGRVTWDGRNSAGNLLSPGVYFVRLRTGNEVRSQKVMLVR